jgi:hypothetical protein
MTVPQIEGFARPGPFNGSALPLPPNSDLPELGI